MRDFFSHAECALALALALVAAAPARADDIVVPPVPEPSCQCGPNGTWILCSRCPSGDDDGRSSNTTATPQGVPPIVKVAAFAVAGAVVAGMFAIAPGHTVSLFASSTSAQQAREAWQDDRAATLGLERTHADAVVLRGELARVEAAATRAPAGYAGVDAVPTPPAAWAPSGACGQVLAANDRALAELDRRATAEARAQFPTWDSLAKQARRQIQDGIARAAGVDKLWKQAKALEQDYRRAREMDAFLKELAACEDARLVEPTNDCEQKIYDRVNAELKVFLDELQAGAGDAHERVRAASKFYRGYVNDLRREVEQQALWTARCR